MLFKISQKTDNFTACKKTGRRTLRAASSTIVKKSWKNGDAPPKAPLPSCTDFASMIFEFFQPRTIFGRVVIFRRQNIAPRRLLSLSQSRVYYYVIELKQNIILFNLYNFMSLTALKEIRMAFFLNNNGLWCIILNSSRFKKCVNDACNNQYNYKINYFYSVLKFTNIIIVLYNNVNLDHFLLFRTVLIMMVGLT